MDPLTQGTLGASLSQTATTPGRMRAFAIAGALAGLAPDLDILIRSSTDPIVYLEYHRQFTHSLVFIPAGAGIVALLLQPLLTKGLPFRATYLACLLGYSTHALLDACTSYGTQLYWPLSDTRVAWNWISVVDPLFSVPLFLLAAVAAMKRKRAFAVAGLCWAVVYLAAGAIQNQRAIQTAEALAAARGHQPVRLTVKPGFANLVVWKSIYEADGYIYVDGIRLTETATYCAGDRIRHFDPRRDLPWLVAGSRQARDLERFGWYSDGWLAVDPEDPGYVVDVRYAALPNRIDALWGLKVDPLAAAEDHAAWHVERSRRSRELGGLLALLAGRGCRPIAD